MTQKLLQSLLLLALGTPALAQTDAPQITPKNGQTPEQMWSDRYECYRWAKTQSGFDPAQHAADAPASDAAAGAELYKRAFSACLEGHGYSVTYGAPPAPAPAAPVTPPPHPPGWPASQTAAVWPAAPRAPELHYRPLTVQIDGGYTVATGATHDDLNDGWNVGVGLGWFPAAALPIGIRVDGSYSRFDAASGLLNSGGGYNQGHENIYGGDADLQFDLAHRSDHYKLYLFGGAGWYREQIRLQAVGYQPAVVCGFYYCAPGFAPVVTADQHSTSQWHNAWNGGIGWEVAVADHESFFIEARYLRIGPRTTRTDFVPIRFGFRF